ncbi:thiamine biosynthesis protein ThiS [Marmoricola endophyticus]|uniref:Thiamine biosynthesis protein ThiS n=1 Tax=Marmoricola endophyticus TaxID=2040280 RepID=A0A917BLE3_9ACTN|nr:sulfur carrier protein ThiS [Marmoricola endophyticus]GGF46973.1 thiamine biosynthesis protein ThiS [Marmoricola endophyticus]
MRTTVHVNGIERDLAPETSLERLVADLVPRGRDADAGDRVRGVASALNGTVVPRGDWASTTLSDGDRVEVVTATQGG